MRDSWTGYLLPVRDGLGIWPDGRVLGTPPPSPPSSGNHLETVTLTVLGFRAWIGLIWEISPRKSRQISWNFGPRLSCKNVKMSIFNDIYNIKVFLDTDSENGFFPYASQSPDPAARPPAHPSWIKTESEWLEFQYFHVQNWIKMTSFPVFPCSKLNQNDLGSSTSMFKTESKWLEFQYFHVQNWLSPFIDP